jgi:hypothetical protein
MDAVKAVKMGVLGFWGKVTIPTVQLTGLERFAGGFLPTDK